MDKQLLIRLEMAIKSDDWDTASVLRDDAICYILDSLMGDDTEGLQEQVWILHQIQSKLYARL